jgi:hypothetical protein
MRVLAAFVLLASPLGAQDSSVTHAEGLAAWDRIYAITSHPRCTNCHVGDTGQPMWNALNYGTDTVHGMGVQADETRIGALSMPCRTCHVTAGHANTVPHAPPHIDDAWRLPPVALEWLGKTSAEVCAQLRNPDSNDGNDIAGLADHLRSSPFVAWGFAPGTGRTAPAGDPEEIAKDIEVWGAAGAPCS